MVLGRHLGQSGGWGGEGFAARRGIGILYTGLLEKNLQWRVEVSAFFRKFAIATKKSIWIA